MKSPKCHYSVFPLLQNTGCRMQMVEFYFQLLLVSKQSATTEHFKNSGPICRHKDIMRRLTGGSLGSILFSQQAKPNTDAYPSLLLLTARNPASQYCYKAGRDTLSNVIFK